MCLKKNRHHTAVHQASAAGRRWWLLCWGVAAEKHLRDQKKGNTILGPLLPAPGDPAAELDRRNASCSQGLWTQPIISPCGSVPSGQQSRQGTPWSDSHSWLLCPALVRDQKERFKWVKTLFKAAQSDGTPARTSKLCSQLLFPAKRDCASTGGLPSQHLDPFVHCYLPPMNPATVLY